MYYSCGMLIGNYVLISWYEWESLRCRKSSVSLYHHDMQLPLSLVCEQGVHTCSRGRSIKLAYIIILDNIIGWVCINTGE